MGVTGADRVPADLVRRLAAAGCVAPEGEAAEFVAAAPGGRVPESWLARREAGEPLAWIVGSVRFAGLRLRAVPGVYVPRPQTEALARRAAALLPPGGRALDLCTGIGAVAAHLRAAVPGTFVVGVDIDERAARAALANGVPTVVGDLDGARSPIRRAGAGRRGGDPGFDVVTAVAPYVPSDEVALLPAEVQAYEPRRALDGGADGLASVRRVAEVAATRLRSGGWLLVEVGGGQDRLLAPDLAALGFVHLDPWHDEEGDLRGVAARVRAGRSADGP